jgi:hypothetical protein
VPWRRSCPARLRAFSIDRMTATILILLAVGIIANLLIARLRSRRRARRTYQEALDRAYDDGILTADEIEELERLRSEKDLSGREVHMAALALYRRAVRDAAEDEQLTEQEDEQLRRLQEQLGLSERDLGSDLMRVSRLRALAAITSGSLPDVNCPIDLVPDERCHWVVHATLAQRLDLPAPSGGLRGIRFAVLDANPFHAQGERDPLRPSEVIMPIDLGVLVVTSRRTVFQGARRTVSVPHARLQHVVLYRDAVGLEEITGASRFLLVDDAELTSAVVLHAARLRRAEIRPTSTGKTA